MDLDKIIKILIKNSEITTLELTKIGYITEDVYELVKDGYIKPKDKGTYQIGKYDTLFNYGLKKMQKKDYKFANEIFEYCYKINPNDYNVNIQLFDRAIKNKDENIFLYFNIIYEKLIKEKQEKNANYYLILLSRIVELPDRYKRVLKEVALDDILIEDEEENKIRKKIYFREYREAHELYKEKKNLSQEDNLVIDFISVLMDEYRKFRDLLLNYIDKDSITKLYELLTEEKENLNMDDQYLLKLVLDYISIKDNKKIEIINKDSNDYYQAINNKDYKKAMDYIEDKKSSLYLMLLKIQELIDNTNKLDEDTKKLIDKYIEEIKNGKLVRIINNLPDSITEDALKYLDGIEEIDKFTLGKRIVIRYKPKIEGNYKINKIIKEAKTALYEEKDYEKAEKLYRKLLQIGTPRDFVYGEYGLVLLNLNRIKEATMYLKLAGDISKQNGGNLDYSRIINRIKTQRENKKEKKEENKLIIPKPNFRIDNFNLNLDYLNDLVVLVREGEFDLEEAMNKLKLDENNKNYVRMLYARECYYNSNYTEGDIYLSKVFVKLRENN